MGDLDFLDSMGKNIDTITEILIRELKQKQNAKKKIKDNESAYLESNSDVKVNEYELDGEIVRSAGNGGMFSSSGGQSCIVDAFFFETLHVASVILIFVRGDFNALIVTVYVTVTLLEVGFSNFSGFAILVIKT